MAGFCQDCTGCCETLEVREINKAFGEPCKHLGNTLFGRGCQIYAKRPDSCQRYVCLWLDSQRRGNVERFPENMRPDATKVVMGWPWGEDRETLFVYPYVGFETHWQKDPIKTYLQNILKRGAKVVVVLPDKRISIKGDMAFVGTESEFEEILK